MCTDALLRRFAVLVAAILSLTPDAMRRKEMFHFTRDVILLLAETNSIGEEQIESFFN